MSIIIYACLKSELTPKSGPKTNQKSIKNRCQNALRSWLCFLIDVWSVLALKADDPNPKTIGNSLYFVVFSWFRRFQVDVRFVFDFGANLAPFWHQKWWKSEQKAIEKGIQILIGFLINFKVNLKPCTGLQEIMNIMGSTSHNGQVRLKLKLEKIFIWLIITNLI